MSQNQHIKKNKCSCGEKCSCSGAERLTVSCGCNMEAKQYEYKMDIKCCHSEHVHDKQATKEPKNGKRIVYTCPMHPEVIKDAPGKCPGCGMDLIPKKESAETHASHDIQKASHKDHEAAMTNPQMAKQMEADMRRRFWVSFILSIPIFIYSPVGEKVFGIILPSPIPINWLLLILTTPIVFWTGSIFITGTYYSLKAKKLNMAVLIVTGVLAAYLFSALLTIIMPGSETFYEAAALLVTFVLFGHWMEMKSRRGTSDALRALFDLVPPKANVIRDLEGKPLASDRAGGKEITILSNEIAHNDIVVIRPGNKIPVDGKVIEGETSIDESLVTGESLPVFKKIGDDVTGGSINQNGAIKFRATKVGSETVLASIIKMVETAQNSKAPGQRIADRAAGYLVIVAIGSGLLAFFGWYFVAGTTIIAAMTFAVSTVVIACPDALGLATPTAVAVGTGIGAKHNILIKDAATLENTAKINSIILDKTGTLTKGQPEVTDIVSFLEIKDKEVQNRILQIAASIEKKSEHPLAKTITETAEKSGLSILDVQKFEAIAGHGVRALIVGLAAGIGKTSSHPLDTAIQRQAEELKAHQPEIEEFKVTPGFGLSGKIKDGEQTVLFGNQKLMELNQVSVSPEVKRETQNLQEKGKTVMLLALDQEIVGAIAVADTVRENSKKTIRELKKLNIETIMLTGDNQRTAEAIAEQLGIDRVFAEVLPAHKAEWVTKLQKEGKFVAMVGDGINDAPALAQADIGIAIGAGTDVAIETGNIVLMKSDPYDIVAAMRLSKATVTKMKQNLFWAAIYNMLAIPVAAGVFYNSLGWTLRPEIAALLMSASSIIVATNAVLLKRVEPKLKI